ncbi:putative epoxide hydrolase [Lophiostoma macrostomum CBS 122681]|uniref:Putative epoxide hydrolase n=1 Tax=Lophiostoma macrostomum CBS 122681 TaxID=1314788 RepID=A0A6A6TED6_9PLEO|nr:putative epoxide hydrolase [Lophiostoma macrostomum CBS 122681]
MEKSKKVQLHDGTTYAYIHIPPSDPARTTFLLLHGFPSSSFDWRHVITPLQQHGFGVIAPDLLGYGDTDKPKDVSAYSMKRMADHLGELVQLENVQKLIGVGHDFGSGLLSCAALAYPSLFAGVVFTSVGYIPPGLFDIDQLNGLSTKVLGYPTFGYWKFFDEDDAAAILEANPDSKSTIAPLGTAKAFLTSGKTGPLPAWLSEEDAWKRTQIFEKGGYTGPLNWYKATMGNIDASYASSFTTDESKSITVPALVVVGEQDYVCVADFQTQSAAAYLRNHRIESLPCGHWIPLEEPTKLVHILEDFEKTLTSG